MTNDKITPSILKIIELLNSEGYNIIYIDNTLYNIISILKAGKDYDTTTLKGSNVTDLITNLSANNLIQNNIIKTFETTISILPTFSREFSRDYEFVIYSL